jgi:dTDP-4-dehydrorhamnose reductase
MRTLVTGADGLLGRALMPVLAARGEVIGADRDVDVTDAHALDDWVRGHRPDAVVHLAAWTDVDGAESREDEAAAVNAGGAANVARAAARAGAVLILPSTDYVFAGDAGRPYCEDDPVGPINAYGRTKLAGERAALAAHPHGVRIARTAWLYGAGGGNFVDTMRRVGADRDAVEVVDDQRGSPTWTGDLAPALVALIERPPGIYHVACGGSATWADLAEAVFAETNAACRVRRIASAAAGRAARRPACSALISARADAPRLRHWRAALSAYLRENPVP